MNSQGQAANKQMGSGWGETSTHLQGANNPTSPAKPTALAVLHNELAIINDRLCSFIGKLSDFADRTVGSIPSDATKGEPAPTRVGAVYEVGDQIRKIQQALNVLEPIVSRIEQIA